MRASTSSASASSGETEARHEPSARSTPTRRRRRSPPSSGKVRSLTRQSQHRPLADLLRRLNPVLRGWCTYFRHGVSTATFGYLDHFAWHRVVGWLRKRHHGLNWKTSPPLPSRTGGRRGRDRAVPARSGRDQPLPLPGQQHPDTMGEHDGISRMTTARLVESRMRGDTHVRFGGRAEETERPQGRHRASARPNSSTTTPPRSRAAPGTGRPRR